MIAEKKSMTLAKLCDNSKMNSVSLHNKPERLLNAPELSANTWSSWGAYWHMIDICYSNSNAGLILGVLRNGIMKPEWLTYN